MAYQEVGTGQALGVGLVDSMELAEAGRNPAEGDKTEAGAWVGLAESVGVAWAGHTVVVQMGVAVPYMVVGA